jgi:hypothetical protein
MIDKETKIHWAGFESRRITMRDFKAICNFTQLQGGPKKVYELIWRKSV